MTFADRIRSHELFAEWRRTRSPALLHTIALELSADVDMRLVKQAIRDAAKPRKQAGRGRPRKDRSIECVCPRCGAQLVVQPWAHASASSGGANTGLSTRAASPRSSSSRRLRREPPQQR